MHHQIKTRCIFAAFLQDNITIQLLANYLQPPLFIYRLRASIYRHTV